MVDITAREAKDILQRFSVLDSCIDPIELEMSVIHKRIFSIAVYDSTVYSGITYKENREKLEEVGFKVDRVYGEEYKDMYKISWRE